MVPEQLEPRLELLREEYVLVQAWKKTASYIRGQREGWRVGLWPRSLSRDAL